MKSFLQGRKTLAVAPLRPVTVAPPAAAAAAASLRAASAAAATSGSHHQVDVVKEGDKIVRIVVTCSCGERTEIECLYPVGG